MRLKAAVLVAAILFTILAVDLLTFYILDIKKPGYRPERFFQYSSITGHFHRPGAEGWWYRYEDGTKYYVRINRHGFADRPRDLRKSGPRIALLGDSTIEFWETDESHRGQYVIEDRVRNQFEVLNFGVRGFGTDQSYLLFKHQGIHFSPDIVIYTFCINDIHDNLSQEDKPYFIADPGRPPALVLRGYPVPKPEGTGSGRKGFLRALAGGLMDRSFVFRRSMLFYKHLFSKRSVPLSSHFELRPYKTVYDVEDETGIEVTTRLIYLMNQLARSNGMKFLLVEGLYRPAVDGDIQKEIIETYGDLFDFHQVTRRLENFAQKNGIPFLSLPGAARAQNVKAAALMHPEDYIHLNRAGIRFYARAVVGKLEDLDWLEAPVDSDAGVE